MHPNIIIPHRLTLCLSQFFTHSYIHTHIYSRSSRKSQARTRYNRRRACNSAICMPRVDMVIPRSPSLLKYVTAALIQLRQRAYVRVRACLSHFSLHLCLYISASARCVSFWRVAMYTPRGNVSAVRVLYMRGRK